MRKIILLSAVLFTAPAFSESKVSVEQLETAMHAAEQDKTKLLYAEELARKAQIQNPDSYKANYYLAQILRYTNKPDMEIYKNKADSIKSEKAKSFLVWLCSIIAICALTALAFFMTIENKKKKEKLIKKQNEKKKAYERSLKSLMDASKQLDELNIYLELNDVKFNNKIYNEIKELKNAILDMIENIHENHSWDVYEVEDLLDNVAKAAKYCRSNF